MENTKLVNGQVVRTQTVDLAKFIADKNDELARMAEDIARTQARMNEVMAQITALVPKE